MKSIRRSIADALVDLFSKIRNGRYTVIRGAVNWPKYKWGPEEWVASINVDDAPILAEAGTMRVGIDVFQKIPNRNSEEGIEDASLDKMFEDLRSVLSDLKRVKYEGGQDNLIMGITNDRAAEAHDVRNQGIQGIVGRATLKF